jgi:hypothetical protein
MSFRATLVTLILVSALATAGVAMAYDETGKSADPADCALCHTVPFAGGMGPHGGYTTTSSGCDACHAVHSASAEGILLMPEATLTDTCELCHDGTGGAGVYGTIEARGLTVQSAHRTETTTVIPGGDASTGGTATAAFGGAKHTLNCGDCHSAHAFDLVEPFTTERSRITSDKAGELSSELLKRQPTGATTETAVFGSDWCGGCHKGRVAGLHGVFNHPVEASSTPGAFSYQNVQVVSGVGSTATVSGSMGKSNFGYVMPYPRSSGQGTHKPICQQCHADSRSVGDVVAGSIAASETFRVTISDGRGASDNPRFQVSPHESANESLLVETEDDLCTNCHHSGQMP